MTPWDWIVITSGVAWGIMAALFAWLSFHQRRDERRRKRVARLETKLGL